MELSFLKEGTVLVKLSAREKAKVFESVIEAENGEILHLAKAIAASAESDEFYSQSVYIGEVIRTADDVKHIEAGDIVVVDYVADIDDNKIAFFDGTEKVVILDALTSYHQEDRIAFASMASRMDTYTWRAGDVDTQSLIYAIFRNGILIPNNEYLLLEHLPLRFETQNNTGITFYEDESEVVFRKVVAAPNNFPIKAGEIIAVENFALLERSIENYHFDVVMTIDYLGKLHA